MRAQTITITLVLTVLPSTSSFYRNIEYERYETVQPLENLYNLLKEPLPTHKAPIQNAIAFPTLIVINDLAITGLVFGMVGTYVTVRAHDLIT